jgi:hypothetical protein
LDYYIKLPSSPNNFIPQRGSFLYYCYRKLPINKQEDLMIIENIQHQLINTCELYKEKLVAIKKLEWWIEEANNIFTNSANHPSLKALSLITGSLDLDKTKVIKLFQSKAKILNGISLSNNSELNKFISEQYSEFEQIKAKILLNENLNQNLIDIVGQLSIAMEKVRYIYLFAHHKVNQIHLLPGYDEKLSKGNQISVLKEIGNQVLKDDNQIKLPGKINELKPLFNRYKLHIKLLKAMKKNNYNVEQERIELSPLQMLFTVK